MLKFYISELTCYQGSGDSAVLSSCTGSPYADRCIKETISGVVTYSCDLASNKIIEGSVADFACSTINSDEICICGTDGCNRMSSSSSSSSMIQILIIPIFELKTIRNSELYIDTGNRK